MPYHSAPKALKPPSIVAHGLQEALGVLLDLPSQLGELLRQVGDEHVLRQAFGAGLPWQHGEQMRAEFVDDNTGQTAKCIERLHLNEFRGSLATSFRERLVGLR